MLPNFILLFIFREDRGENRFERRDREVRTGEFRSEGKEFRGGEGGDNRGRGRGLSNRGLNRGRGRGGRGGYDGRGKREFDRQSGSDKTYVSCACCCSHCINH